MNDIETERRALALFEAFLDVDEDRQTGWLDGQEGITSAIRAKFSELIMADTANQILTGGALNLTDARPPPERIGAYRIGERIGAGGMGAVYEASRASGDFDHSVAIKLIKPGLLSEQLADRFADERQLLARFSHPNIARLFDGGKTECGQPYIVMELIEGIPLSEWVRQEQPNLEQRLRIFGQICDAVGYAHRHLVIHRDLSPANVLVDLSGDAKLIDFGIARLDGEGGGRETEGGAAQLQHLTLTPGYAAPERLRGEAATTLGDIYSAGRLLKLLVEKPRDHELQAIADKAMAEEPTDRYQSIVQLADDIDRFLNGQTVAAMPFSYRYGLTKLVSRNRLLSAAVAVLVLAIVAGTATTTWKWREADTAREEATARLADTRELANVLMFDAFDELGRAGNTRARLLMARNAQRYLEQLATDPTATFNARLAAGTGHYRLGMITGAPDGANTGALLEGLKNLQKSHTLLTALHEERPGDDTRLALGATRMGLMLVWGRSYLDVDKAVEFGREASKIVAEVERPTIESVALAARIDRYLGDILGCCAGDPENGKAVIVEGLRKLDAAPASIRASFEARRARNDLLNLTAGYRLFEGEDTDGIPIFQQALASQRQLLEESGQPEDRELEATIAGNLGRTLLRMGEFAAADRILAPSHATAIEEYSSDRSNNALQRRLAILSLARAWIAAEQGAGDRSRAMVKEGLELARLADWPEGFDNLPSLNFAHRLQEASEAYWAMGDRANGCAVARRSVAMYRAYERELALPETALRYRLARMTGRLKECSVER